MTYRVEYMPRVIAAIEDQVQYLREQGASDDRITAWLTELFEITDSLYHSPRRHPVAEDETAEIGIEIRRLTFGDYLIYYHVDDDRLTVDVLHFRHGAHHTNRLTASDEMILDENDDAADGDV